jgi:isoquinoline 1-oxidoreductase alpha subunit
LRKRSEVDAVTIEFSLNERSVSVADSDGEMPLLWYLRERAGLKGTKFGCGIGQCGACTVHFNDAAMRSCQIKLSTVNGNRITTIEGLAKNGVLHPVQQAWLDIDVAQCGYCQAGQIMAAAALLRSTPRPDDAQMEAELSNLCRCGTYVRIREAVKKASAAMSPASMSASS